MVEYTVREFKRVKGKKIYIGQPQRIVASSRDRAAWQSMATWKNNNPIDIFKPRS